MSNDKTNNKTYVVRVSRIYEIPEKDIIERLDLEDYKNDKTTDRLHRDTVSEAENMAIHYMSEEIDFFTNKVNDFVSAEVIKIK